MENNEINKIDYKKKYFKKANEVLDIEMKKHKIANNTADVVRFGMLIGYVGLVYLINKDKYGLEIKAPIYLLGIAQAAKVSILNYADSLDKKIQLENELLYIEKSKSI